MSLSRIEEVVQLITENIGKYVVNYREHFKALVLTAVIRGHILIYGPPGAAKTFTAKLFSQLVGLRFSRIQFTPDILPSDILGAKVIDPKTGELRTVLGPVFANVVLADEINRANPKSLAALLEVMQERQVTIEGDTHRLPEPFIVIATLNPVEAHGVFPVPIAVLDRFMTSLAFNYVGFDDEVEMVQRDLRYDLEHLSLKPVIEPEDFSNLYEEVKKIRASVDIVSYCVEIVRALRSRTEVSFGPSPRATLHLIRLARSMAAVEGRDYVIPDDVKKAAKYVLRHRVITEKSDLMTNLRKAEEIISEVLKSVKPPW
ncbi:MAG: AAA family ATPase [Desulfurococcales archaeon]|nr:AAA family ATPase [Desulfurococcales archaeon]